ncbi:hypothetical protein ACJIZ3_003241 [Penstemon smallii]|uniref:FAF domain-containing protein n=1 Tax=Penstemon smallii TaxID=265156 RepID=A0ABD3UCG0_9LAMI
MQNPELVDYIGMESCFDLESGAVDTTPSPPVGLNNRRHRIRSSTADNNYPPPITCLARTENLPSHMPWVMRKYYGSDGRLIIKEEKVKRHEYFTAHRSNGRLVLNLVPLDDAVEESCREHQNAVEEINGGDDVVDDDDDDPTVEEEGFVECFKCSGGGGFGVAVPAFRPPLHT